MAFSEHAALLKGGLDATSRCDTPFIKLSKQENL
jgi:hypothetical protein